MKHSEQKIYGRNACLAFAHKYPQTVIRAYCTEATQGRFGFLLKKLAQAKRAYHIVTDAELNKLSESEHHEGVLLLVERPALQTDETLLRTLSLSPATRPEHILCLDGVTNPHNLGAIVRTAAHFGFHRIVLLNLGSEQLKSLISSPYHRTAEGGSVRVELTACNDAVAFLEKLKTSFNFKLAVTSSHERSTVLHRVQLPKRMVLVLGSESDGVSASIMQKADLKICIQGTGDVESLNVANAASVLMYEWYRQTQRAVAAPLPRTPTPTGRASGRKRMGS